MMPAARACPSILARSGAPVCAKAKKVSYEITQDHRSGKFSTDQLNEIRDRLFSGPLSVACGG